MDGSQWFAYDRSGRILAIADGGELLVHDGPTEAPRWRQTCESAITALAAIADRVVTTDAAGRLALWDARRPSLDFHPRHDDRDVGLPALAQLTRADVATVGAKAAQLGELAHVAPALRLPRFPGCGHFPHRECPEAFAHELRAFLHAPTLPAPRLRPAALEAPRRSRLGLLLGMRGVRALGPGRAA
jgi:pimeloyl-ACP methyl ester carboxylesterase